MKTRKQFKIIINLHLGFLFLSFCLHIYQQQLVGKQYCWKTCFQPHYMRKASLDWIVFSAAPATFFFPISFLAEEANLSTNACVSLLLVVDESMGEVKLVFVTATPVGVCDGLNIWLLTTTLAKSPTTTFRYSTINFTSETSLNTSITDTLGNSC